MVRRIGFGGMVALAAWAAASPGADGPARTGVIVGRLVDLEGRPVPGGSIWGMSLQDEVGRARSDSDGRFRLGPLPDDKPVDVWFEAGGLARDRREGVHVFDGRDHDLGTLAMAPGTRVEGRVVDSGGRPIPGAGVSIEVYRRVLGHTITSNQARWEAKADDRGRFETEALPPGEAALAIGAAGKVRASLSRRTLPGLPAIDLGEVRLEDEVPTGGIIVDQDGKPAPKVEVVADYDYENTAVSDKDGRFSLGGIGKGAKELRLSSNDYFAPEPFPIGPDRSNLRLQVRRAYTILGSAVDAETGAPVTIDSVRLCIVEHEPDGTTSLRG